jgi:hypothetical protein
LTLTAGQQNQPKDKDVNIARHSKKYDVNKAGIKLQTIPNNCTANRLKRLVGQQKSLIFDQITRITKKVLL